MRSGCDPLSTREKVLKLMLAALVVRLLVRFGVRYLWARGRLLVHKLLKRLHVV